MAKWNVPSEGKAVELTSKILEKQILKALELALKYREEAQIKAKGNYKLDARWTTRRTQTWKKRVEAVSTQIKKLRRGLGGVILTNPEYYKKTGLFTRIAEKVNNPENWVAELAGELGTWDDDMAQTSKVNKFNPAGKVGHHRTALGVLRDAIEPLDVNVRAEFKQLALADGYKVGEEYLDYIDPAAHKALTKKVYGVLRDKLNIKHVDEIDPKHLHILDALTERSAHAAAYGKEAGIVMPKELLKKGASADEIYKYARPYLELQKRGADAGLQLDEILTSNRWNTLEDLFEVVQKEMPLADTTPILNKMRVDLMESGLYDPKIGRAKIKGRGYVKDLPQAHLSVEDVYKNVWEPIDMKGLNALTDKIKPVTKAGTELYSGLPLGTVQDHIETAKDVGKAIVGTTKKGRLVRGAALVGGVTLRGLPVIGAGMDAYVAGEAWHQAKQDPSIKNIGAAVGESMILADQVTPFGAIGQIGNQIIRQYTDPERGAGKIRGRYGAKKAMEAKADWEQVQQRSQRRLKTWQEEEEYNLL